MLIKLIINKVTKNIKITECSIKPPITKIYNSQFHSQPHFMRVRDLKIAADYSHFKAAKMHTNIYKIVNFKVSNFKLYYGTLNEKNVTSTFLLKIESCR